MTIAGASDEQLREVLAENLTLSDTVKTPERLFGGEKNLRTIDRALNSPSRQILIYGDRGVGRTCLARTAGYLHSAPESPSIHVMSGNGQSRVANATIYWILGQNLLIDASLISDAAPESIVIHRS
jgi:hypothetical protein